MEILGVGIDIEENRRFDAWDRYSDLQLGKIFSLEEIGYCRNIPKKSAERFAGRFAAREAIFKAISSFLGLGFFETNRLYKITRLENGQPVVVVTSQAPNSTKAEEHVRLGTLDIKISISHTKNQTVAIAIANLK